MQDKQRVFFLAVEKWNQEKKNPSFFEIFTRSSLSSVALSSPPFTPRNNPPHKTLSQSELSYNENEKKKKNQAAIDFIPLQ